MLRWLTSASVENCIIEESIILNPSYRIEVLESSIATTLETATEKVVIPATFQHCLSLRLGTATK